MTLLVSSARLAVVTLIVAIAGVALPSPAGAADEFLDRTVTVSPPVAAFGTQMVVNGAGWPGGAVIQASPCGNGGFNGTADCASSSAVTANATGEGDFAVDLQFTKPPKPCPCVVRVDVISAEGVPDLTSLSVASPVTIPGADEAPIEVSDFARELSVSATVEGVGPWTAWFGGRAEREVRFTVSNTGNQQVLSPPTTVTFGSSSAPTEILARPDLGAIAPGETRTYSVPVTIDAPAVGRYTAVVTIRGLDQSAIASAPTSVVPWGLVLVAFLLLQIPLLGLYRRSEPSPVSGPAPSETPDELMPLASDAALVSDLLGGSGAAMVPGSAPAQPATPQPVVSQAPPAQGAGGVNALRSLLDQ